MALKTHASQKEATRAEKRKTALKAAKAKTGDEKAEAGKEAAPKKVRRKSSASLTASAPKKGVKLRPRKVLFKIPGLARSAPIVSRQSSIQPDSPGGEGGMIAGVREELGVTQTVFARMLGVSLRSVAGWESGGPINESSLRRVTEMSRLAASLRSVMREEFVPRWLVTPNEGMGGISPVEALERGENDRLWRSVFLLGSGLPI
jgi:DNA-binding XRE family transcriptional regulator